jgi:glycogen operon protein
VNFVTCHDGFTLEDLVSYERKHNEANGEANRDGHDDNLSRNWGVEGATAAARVLHARDRAKRNLLATLAFSLGVPMLSQGDELGRTQLGNNNAYCQDGVLTWIDWEPDERGRELLAFVRRVFEIRRQNPVFRRRRCFAGGPVGAAGEKDVSWLKPEGGELSPADWAEAQRRALGMWIHGEASDEVDERGRPSRGQTLLLLLNGGARSCLFQLPDPAQPGLWWETLNTARPGERRVRGEGVHLLSHSLVLLAHRPAA